MNTLIDVSQDSKVVKNAIEGVEQTTNSTETQEKASVIIYNAMFENCLRGDDG